LALADHPAKIELKLVTNITDGERSALLGSFNEAGIHRGDTYEKLSRPAGLAQGPRAYINCLPNYCSFSKARIVRTSQIRRCAASVAANIAEGCGKRATVTFNVSWELLVALPANLNIMFFSLEI
jgi:23S rRNA-intervening sequence protein